MVCIISNPVPAPAGFPVESAEARKRFYVWGNGVYQLGVFVSRSSGMHFQVGGGGVWIAMRCGYQVYFSCIFE